MTSNSIFLITCTCSGENFSTRTFGFEFSLEKAQGLISKYGHEIEESYYSYLVIEEFKPAIHSNAIKEWWYKWGKKGWEPIDKPKEYENVCNWGMG
jgi:hypothetical protein